MLFIRVIENKCPFVALGWTGWTWYQPLTSCFPGREVEEEELGNTEEEKGRPVLRWALRAQITDCYLHVADLDSRLVGLLFF